MLDENTYQKPFILAISLHVLLLGFLLSHFKMSAPNPVVQSSNNVIKAVAVNQSSLQTPMRSAQQQQALPQKLQPVEQQKIDPKKITQPQTAQVQIQKAATQQVEQKVLEQQQRVTEGAMQQQVAMEAAAAKAEQQKLQQAKAKQQAQKKIAQEQKYLAAQAIEQALAEQEKQTKQATAAQQKQKQLQAAKLDAQKLLQQQLAATNTASQQTNTLSSAGQGQIDKYAALIKNAIGQQWIIPDNSQKNLQGKMQVKVAPGGMVLSVQITQSSGDAAFDRAARAAVFKASPLPTPKETTLFEQFRILNLTFKPDGIST